MWVFIPKTNLKLFLSCKDFVSWNYARSSIENQVVNFFFKCKNLFRKDTTRCFTSFHPYIKLHVFSISYIFRSPKWVNRLYQLKLLIARIVVYTLLHVLWMTTIHLHPTIRMYSTNQIYCVNMLFDSLYFTLCTGFI